jgi:DNA repair photolyase
MKLKVREIKAKSILSKTGLPDCDWVINPYTGCRFGCKYCYAAFVGRFKHPGEEWGSYVDVKVNAPQLLKKELETKLKGKKIADIGIIFMSSVTDPYQGLEAKYKLTRKCLQVFADLDYQGEIGILTKSSLVTRDIDLFKKLRKVEVGLTVTSTGDPISKYLETYASPNEDRIETLKKLNKAGVKTYAFVGPLLPHFVWMEKEMENLLKQLKDAGVGYIYLEHINLSSYIKERLFKYLKKDHPELLEKFQKAQSPKYRQELDDILDRLVKKVGIRLAYQKPIYHKDKESWKRLGQRRQGKAKIR